MRRIISLLAHSAFSVRESSLGVPIALFLSSVARDIKSPPAQSLLLVACSWTLVWLRCVLSVGLWVKAHDFSKTKYCVLAGALFTLAQLCERASNGGLDTWWPKVAPSFLDSSLSTTFTDLAPQSLVPLLVFLVARFELVSKGVGTPPATDGLSRTESRTINIRWRMLATATGCALIALQSRYFTPQNLALGLCQGVFLAASLLILEFVVHSNTDSPNGGAGGLISANGSFSRRNSKADPQDSYLTSLRDFSAVVALTSALVLISTDGPYYQGLHYNSQIAEAAGENWKLVQSSVILKSILPIIPLALVQNLVVASSVCNRGTFDTSVVILGGALFAKLYIVPSSYTFWFSFLFAASIFLVFYDAIQADTHATYSKRRIRGRYLISTIAMLSFIAVIYLYARDHTTIILRERHGRPSLHLVAPADRYEPVSSTPNVHPIELLSRDAEQSFNSLVSKQSKSLAAAVREYRLRYGMPPPPNFDRWYEFAVASDVQLIDEYDTIYHSLLPFWALEPSAIRHRVKEALGFEENNLLGFLIRAGKVTKVERGEKWMQQALVGMVEKFKEFLPDMDLAFNIHDEPRVMVAAERLSRMVQTAITEKIPRVNLIKQLQNGFSDRPADLGDGSRIEDSKTTRFNHFAHQPIWTHCRLSCPADSPSQAFGETFSDNRTAYAMGDLGFLYNQTAHADICLSPSFRSLVGFFERPNAFNLAQDLVPIFSTSKISSFQDIVYPSPWYWHAMVRYDEERDMNWETKNETLYWRGSTTGGYSRDGGWRHHHRQHVVKRLNSHDIAKILKDKGGDGSALWETAPVKRQDYKDLVDVHFTHVGQCDESDCDAQKAFFDIADPADQQDAWNHKYLLDMDGNAFSGRFYAFLKSKSQVYKMAIFKEWHNDWLKPWLHFVPMSLLGDEWLESLRYFSAEPKGKESAQMMAQRSTDWANKILRNEDIEVWFFRLLLEYGRIIDDNRDKIGYPGP